MKKGGIVGLLVLIIVAVLIGAVLFFQNVNVAVLNPQGEIARQQRDLIVFTTLLGMSVILPVFAMLGIFAWKYREGNHKARYRPDWDGDKRLEAIWWGIPCVIILILSIVTWQTSHQLDPYKSLSSTVNPVKVQVVALQWKWLFIYPDFGVASVNYMHIPEKTPIDLTVTSDAPMNAFWVPSLGGQVYAMSGMSAKLHLMADHTGDYKGSSANVSGKGFANMAFTVHSSSPADFTTWTKHVKGSSDSLDMAVYTKLALPASINKPVFYALKEDTLYDKIVMKYMMPTSHKHDEQKTPAETNVPAEHNHSSNMPAMEGL